jgi:hypothetical protein
MIKPIVKTLSLSFVMLAGAAIASASEQSPLMNLAAVPVDALRVGCSSTAEIERGWEAQQQLLQERVAAKAAETVHVPGTIISTPLTEFMPQALASAPSISEGKEARTPRRGAARSGLGQRM